jgi:hypothetical protein
MTIKIPEFLKNEEFRFILLNKDSKIPCEKKWESINNYKYNDPKLLKHLEDDGNYGVLAGHGRLRILDADNLEFAENCKKIFETLTVKTCGGGLHFYCLSDINENLVFKEGEFRANNMFVVGPNCYVKDTKKNHEGEYTIIKELPLLEIKSLDFLNINNNSKDSNNINQEIIFEKVDKAFIENTIFPTLLPDKKDMILTHAEKGHRSEWDEKVIVHLVLKGYSKYIKSIFDLYPIGIKYKEHPDGEAYLKKCIEKASNYSGATDENITLLEQEIFNLPKTVLKNKINEYLLKISKIKDEIQRVPLLELIKEKTKISVKELKERLHKLVYDKVDNKIYTLRDLMSHEFKKPEYYIDNFLLKNSITLIAGKSGRFKTMLSLAIALSLTKGQKFVNNFQVNESPKVLYYDLDENGEASFVSRTNYLLNGMGLDQEILDRLHVTYGFLTDNLDKEIEKAKEYDIVFLDSYRRFLKGDENKSEITNQFFKDYLAKLKHIGKTTVVLLHFKKADFEGLDDEDLIDAVRGSSDIVSQADVYYCLTKTEDEVDNVTRNRKFEVSVVAPKDRDGSVVKKFSLGVFKNVQETKTELNFLGYKKTANKTTRNRETVLKMILNEKRIKRFDLIAKVREKLDTISNSMVDKIIKDLALDNLIDISEYGYCKVPGYFKSNKIEAKKEASLNDFDNFEGEDNER